MALKVLFGFSPLPARPADNENTPTNANWTEGLTTAISVSAAVLVVATIAAVIGMASP